MTEKKQTQTAQVNARTFPGASVLELEVPKTGSGASSGLVVSAVVPLGRERDGPVPRDLLPGFLVEGIAADVHGLARDALGLWTTVVVTAPVDLKGRPSGSFARLSLEPTGEPYQPSELHDVPELDLEFTLQTLDGFFRAKPFAAGRPSIARGEVVLGRWASTWKTWALLQNEHGETRGLVHASLQARDDGLAVVEFLVANAIQTYSEQARGGGDFCYRQLEVSVGGSIALPMPRAGEKVFAGAGPGGGSVLRLIADGKPHLWPRMQGALRRIVLAPPGASAAVMARAVEVGRFFGTAFAIEGPNSWIETSAHGPELGRLAPWTDALDRWGKRGQAGARDILAQAVGAIEGPRVAGKAGGPFVGDAHGLFHGLGQFQEGEPGGTRIRPVGSFALDRRLLLERWLELEHDLDRSRTFHFEPRGGKPTTAQLWAARFGGRIPFAFRNDMSGGFPWMKFRVNTSGTVVLESNVTQGAMVAHGDGELFSIFAQDAQHWRRRTEPPETLVRFTGSPIAALVLESLAASAELARHTFPSPASGDVTLADLVAEASVPSKRGKGTSNAGRALAWELGAIAAFWEIAPDAWRELRRSWIGEVARWATLIRSDCGLLANDTPKGHNSQVAVQQGAPPGWRYVQTFEEAYLEQALGQLATVAMPGAVHETVLEQVRAGIRRATAALWSVRQSSTGLPPKFVAVGKESGPELPKLDRTLVSSTSERTWIWGLIATAARIAEEQGDQSGKTILVGTLLAAGHKEGQPAANFESYVRESQALERDPWMGSADYSALAWGEAWRAKGDASKPFQGSPDATGEASP